MRRFVSLFAACVVLALVVSITVLAEDTDQADEIDKKIRSLREERVGILQQAVEQVGKMYETGVTDFRSVVDFQLQLSEAKLELADTPAEKKAALEEQLDAAKEYVEFTNARFLTGSTSMLDVHLAKSNALRVEIELTLLQRGTVTKDTN
jgi:outer membrane protein TolC